MMANFRQGDVPLMPWLGTLEGLEPVPPVDGKLILMMGTATGHHHRIEGCSLSDDLEADIARLHRNPATGSLVLEVGPRGAALVHEEHSTIDLPPGRYQQLMQVEDTGEMISQVID